MCQGGSSCKAFRMKCHSRRGGIGLPSNDSIFLWFRTGSAGILRLHSFCRHWLGFACHCLQGQGDLTFRLLAPSDEYIALPRNPTHAAEPTLGTTRVVRLNGVEHAGLVLLPLITRENEHEIQICVRPELLLVSRHEQCSLTFMRTTAR
jgi:hypothetical protein